MNIRNEKPVTLPCPTCHKELEQRESRKSKPYFVCESCGVQVFIRYQKGIERLSQATASKSLVLDEYVICRKCQVAVEKSKKKVAGGLFQRAGIYCPSCDGLLLEAKQLG